MICVKLPSVAVGIARCGMGCTVGSCVFLYTLSITEAK